MFCDEDTVLALVTYHCRKDWIRAKVEVKKRDYTQRFVRRTL